MGSGHTHRGGRRFTPRRGPGAANGSRGTGIPDAANAEPTGKKPSSSSSELAPRPHQLTTPPNPAAHLGSQGRDSERAGGPHRASERARQSAPSGDGSRARPFAQTPDPRRGAEPRTHQQQRVEGASPRTSGSHPRPNDHAIARRGAAPDDGLPAGPEYTRARLHTPQARQYHTVASAEEQGAPGTAASPDGTPLAPEDHSVAPDMGEPRPESDGYRHTQHEPVRPETRGEVGPLIEALHEIFERDRGVASQGTSARCGICYLHYPMGELQYRNEEGFYVCASCTNALGHTQVFMVRRQQK